MERSSLFIVRKLYSKSRRNTSQAVWKAGSIDGTHLPRTLFERRDFFLFRGRVVNQIIEQSNQAAALLFLVDPMTDETDRPGQDEKAV
jgi:hypothetical protein